MLAKDLAICIGAVDYSETSQIAAFFAKKNGKINAIAKGAKRPKSPFAGPIEVFSYGQIVFSNSNKKNLVTLTEFEQQAAFNPPAGNLYALNCAFFSAELLTNLTDNWDPHPQLFDCFKQFLNNLSQAKKKSTAVSLLIVFQLALLTELGLQPVLNACVNCKTSFTPNWPQSYFSSSANGFICQDCENSFPDKIRLNDDTADYLGNLTKLRQAPEKTLNEIEKVLVRHFTELLHRPPKMAKYILQS